MKTVLENVSFPCLILHFHLLTFLQPEPIKNLNELAKAQVRYFLASVLSYSQTSLSQLMFFSIAAESLSSIQGEIEELSVAAEGEYR